MIPRDYLQACRRHAPWPDLRQVEQDLIISRALCDLFQSPALAGKIAFRGGTAIPKLLFDQPLRCSEDIDVVQIEPGPVGDFQGRPAGRSALRRKRCLAPPARTMGKEADDSPIRPRARR